MKAYNIRYEKPIVNWDEALPLGDGKLGCKTRARHRLQRYAS